MRETDDVSQPLGKKKRKRFGINHGRYTEWFETEKGRDASWKDLEKKLNSMSIWFRSCYISNMTKVQR